MNKFNFRPEGVMPALVTPFNKDDESINEENLRNLVNHLIDQGVTGLVPVGTTGEFVNMTFEERLKVIEIVVDETNGRVPVIAGTGETGTKLVIEATKAATDIGVDAVLIVTPYYLKPKAKGLYDHYFTIAEKTDVPIVRVQASVLPNGKICIEIRDNGQGIKPDIIDKIFIPFFTSKKDGSGIGLSLSRQIMHLHKGEITVNSQAVSGTVFRLVF